MAFLACYAASLLCPMAGLAQQGGTAWQSRNQGSWPTEPLVRHSDRSEESPAARALSLPEPALWEKQTLRALCPLRIADSDLEGSESAQNAWKAGRESNESPSRDPMDGGTSADSPSRIPLAPYTEHQRFHDYLRLTFGPAGFTGPLLGAAWDQALNQPPEWRQGFAGYGRRLASDYARSVIGNTIRFGVGSLDGEDPRYRPSSARAIWPRARHAIVRTFVYRGPREHSRIALSALAGAYGAAFIANAWYPGPDANVPYALLRGTTAMLSSVGFNLLREFWPRFRRAFQ